MAILPRRSVRSSSAEQIGRYRKAVRSIQAINDSRGYNHVAGLHGAPGGHCWHGQRDVGLLSGVRLFLPWHRAYLYSYEQRLQDVDDGVTVPWWDWRSGSSRSDGLPDAFADERVGGAPNALYDARVWVPSAGIDHRTQRFPRAPDELPDEDAVDRLIRDFDDWSDFQDQLEGIHGQIHGWAGGYKRDAEGWPIDENDQRIEDPNANRDRVIFGDMGSVVTAAFDPIFWSHHCMVDRIWALWQQTHGNSGIPNNWLNVSLEPFGLKVSEVLDIQELGYEYASSDIDIPGGG